MAIPEDNEIEDKELVKITQTIKILKLKLNDYGINQPAVQVIINTVGAIPKMLDDTILHLSIAKSYAAWICT